MLWNTNVEGLTVRSAWAWTDTVYSDDFITATGENLIGLDGAGSADITGFIGFTYDTSLAENWRLSLSTDARFTDDYSWTPHSIRSFKIVFGSGMLPSASIAKTVITHSP